MRPHVLCDSSQHTLDWSCPMSTHYNISHFSVPSNFLGTESFFLHNTLWLYQSGRTCSKNLTFRWWKQCSKTATTCKDQMNAQLQEAWAAEPERLKNITTLAHFRRQTQLLMSLRQHTLISEFKGGCKQPNTNSESSKTVSSSMHCKPNQHFINGECTRCRKTRWDCSNLNFRPTTRPIECSRFLHYLTRIYDVYV